MSIISSSVDLIFKYTRKFGICVWIRVSVGKSEFKHSFGFHVSVHIAGYWDDTILRSLGFVSKKRILLL